MLPAVGAEAPQEAMELFPGAAEKYCVLWEGGMVCYDTTSTLTI
jgi:hypothetical protein